MPDTKITALTAIGANPINVATFPIPMVDLTDTSMAASGTTKKVTVNQILGAGGTATLASATITGDLTVRTTGLTVNSSGVGIGTNLQSSFLGNSPKKLVIGDGTQTPALTLYGGSANVCGLYFADGTVGNQAYRGYVEYDHNTDSFGLGISGSLAMTLNSTGLGVGDAPAANSRLTIGSTNATGFQYALRTTGITTGRSQIYLANTSGDFIAGIEGSTAGQTISGSAAYSSYVGTATSNPFYITTNGSVKATVDSSGNVGIGVTPSAWGSGTSVIDMNSAGNAGALSSSGTLSIANNAFFNGTDWKYKNTSTALLYQLISGTHRWFTAASGTAGTTITDFATAKMTLDASGNLLVGTTTNTNVSRIFSRGTATSSALALQGASGDVALAQLTVGKFDNNTTTSQIFVRFTINDNSGGSGQINANGASQAAFGTFSDSRLKENIVSLPSQLANILSLRPVEFDYKDGSGHQIGFVAQEMQEVYSDAVGEQNGFLTVTGWSKTEARLVSAIKELAAKVQSLEAKLA